MLVIRYEGPKGGPGMREMLSTTAALYGQGVREHRPDHRRPLLRRHARPLRRPRRARRPQTGGPIGLVKDGDIIAIDADAGTIELEVDPIELENRAAPLGSRAVTDYGSGALWKFAQGGRPGPPGRGDPSGRGGRDATSTRTSDGRRR